MNRQRITIIIILLLCAQSLFAIQWESNFDTAKRKAEVQDKLIFAYFYTPIATDCRIVEENVFTRRGIRELANQFIPLRLNAMDYGEIARQVGVFRVPTISVLHPDGTVLEVFIGQSNIDIMSDSLQDLLQAHQAEDLNALQEERLRARQEERLQEKEGRHEKHFRFYHPRASQVAVVGDFNDWNITHDQMMKRGEFWEITLYLEEGRYEYKFFADGRYHQDPANPLSVPDPYGGSNSLLMIGMEDQTSPRIDDNIATFNVYAPDAQTVHIAGNFTNWAESPMRMHRRDGGWWSIVLRFPRGNYEYKYIIDGENWITDPMNPQTVSDDEGNINSVIQIR